MNWKAGRPLSFESYKGKALGMFRTAKTVTEKKFETVLPESE